tara:strand:+ start:2655 stop:3092 length:438 start_codon:yes stop_codon:yes gene_type:complete
MCSPSSQNPAQPPIANAPAGGGMAPAPQMQPQQQQQMQQMMQQMQQMQGGGQQQGILTPYLRGLVYGQQGQQGQQGQAGQQAGGQAQPWAGYSQDRGGLFKDKVRSFFSPDKQGQTSLQQNTQKGLMPQQAFNFGSLFNKNQPKQ